MAYCEWAMLCDYAFLDSAGKLCLIGVFDKIFAASVPTMHPQAALVIQLKGSTGEKIGLRVHIVRPGGTVLLKLEGDLVIGPGGGAGANMRLINLQLPDHGPYSINVYLADDLVKTLPLTVAPPQVNSPS
jgi:hypothetical protein